MAIPHACIAHGSLWLTHEDMFGRGGVANMSETGTIASWPSVSPRMNAARPGLAAYFVKGALDRGIPMHTGINVQELIGDGSRMVGVRATKDGKDFFVKATRGVVLAVSSYERNQAYNKNLGQQLNLQSMVFPSIDGANFRFAGPWGTHCPRARHHIPGLSRSRRGAGSGDLLWRSALQTIGLPHTIVVNRRGRRFGNEAFYRAILYAVDIIDGGNQTHPNFPAG